MIFILVLTLFFKTFSISISNSSYSGFHNFTKINETNIIITVEYENDEINNYNVFCYNNTNLDNNVTCTNTSNISDITDYNCILNKSGVYSIILQNIETSKIIIYKNLITIYDNSSEFSVKPKYSNNKCFDLDNPITNKQLINITFNQTINKSLLTFTLYNDDDKNNNITAIPYEIYENYAIIGVENKKFNAKKYNLNISSKSDYIIYNNTLDLTDTNPNLYPIPIFISFLEFNKHVNRTKIKINTTSEDLRINFTYFDVNNSLGNFDQYPEIIFPSSKMEFNSTNDNNITKFKNTYKFNITTYFETGQAILQYHYCGNEYKNITDLYFVDYYNEEDRYGLSISNIMINKIFLFIIIIIFI